MKIYAGIADEKLSYILEILPVFISILGVLSLIAGGCISMLAQRLKGTTERLKQILNDLKETNLILEEDISREKGEVLVKGLIGDAAVWAAMAMWSI